MLNQIKKPDDSLQLKQSFIQKGFLSAYIISLTLKNQLEIVSENISLSPKMHG